MSVWLAQLKCINNHCILAAASIADDQHDGQELASQVEGQFRAMVAVGALNPHCGLCGAKDFFVDYGPTPFQTLEEAKGPLTELQFQQRVTAEAVKRSLTSSKN